MKATEKLIDFLEFLPSDHAEKSHFYIDVINGRVDMLGIINNPTISIAMMTIEETGFSSEWHEHDSMETFILKSGKPYTMEIKGVGKLRVTETNSVYIPHNVPHRLYDTEGKSKSIVVMVPGTDQFPRGICDE